LSLLFSLKFTEGYLITDHQMTYQKSKIKIDTKNYRKSNLILQRVNFCFQNARQLKDCIYWMACVGPLTKEAWISKILFKIDISLISFQQLDLNRHDLWNVIFDSRAKKNVKQEEHWASLQNPWQKWHQHFSKLLEKLTTWGQYSGPWEGKQIVFR
jgi:hypothetical protein